MDADSLRAAICGNRRVRHFLGVFAKDEVPKLPMHTQRYPICFVVNTDRRYLPGTHWVALYYKTPTRGEFFDSFGNMPERLGFSKKAFPGIEKWNSIRLQSYDADVCGHFCVYFLAKRVSGHIGSETIFSMRNGFRSHDTKHNDDIVRKALRYKFSQKFSGCSRL